MKKLIKSISIITIFVMLLTMLPLITQAEVRAINSISTSSLFKSPTTNTVTFNASKCQLDFTPQYSAEYSLNITSSSNFTLSLYEKGDETDTLLIADNDKTHQPHNNRTVTYNLEVGKTYYYLVELYIYKNLNATLKLDFTSKESGNLVEGGMMSKVDFSNRVCDNYTELLPELKISFMLKGWSSSRDWSYGDGSLIFENCDVIIDASNVDGFDDESLVIYYQGYKCTLPFKASKSSSDVTSSTTTTKPTTTTTTTTTTKPTTTTTTSTTTTTTTQPTTTTTNASITTTQPITTTSTTTTTAPTQYKVKSVTLSKTTYCYNSKVQKPSVTVINTLGEKLKSGTDYLLKYSNSKSKSVGTYTVKITYKGKYSAVKSKTLTYTIGPKTKAIITSLKTKSKSITVKWKKNTNAMGYQIQLATDPSFTKDKMTLTVSKKTTVSKTIKSLKSSKKYYVRVRTYKTVKGKKCYASWSKVKTIKCK